MTQQQQTLPDDRAGSRLARKALSPAALAVLVSMTLGAALFADDWPQYRGPDHTGASPETGIAQNWPKGTPKTLWKKPVGEAFGSFAVAGGRAYLFMERNRAEVLVALNPYNGDEIWAAPIDQTKFEDQGGNGPRSTPTVDVENDRVYVF